VLALLPLLATVSVFIAVINFSDNFLFNLLPENLRPHNIFGRKIPGLGIALSIFFILLTGIFTRNFFGKRILVLTEKIIGRIPFLRTLYATIRQFLESIFMDRSDAFRKVVLIEYPRKGLYTLAFVTSISPNTENDSYKELYTIFVPTTPNPTSGFFIILPNTEAMDVDLEVQEAFSLIVSGGVLSGSTKSSIFSRIQKSIKI